MCVEAGAGGQVQLTTGIGQGDQAGGHEVERVVDSKGIIVRFVALLIDTDGNGRCRVAAVQVFGQASPDFFVVKRHIYGDPIGQFGDGAAGAGELAKLAQVFQEGRSTAGVISESLLGMRRMRMAN